MSRISGGIRGDRSDSELPDEILSVIPTDPFEQLDLAKKITSMAISSRAVSNFEAEAIELRQRIQQREIDTHELEWKVSRLESDFRESDSRLKIFLHENMYLKKERDSLAATVKTLSCDIAKLEKFKKLLVQSLSNEISKEPVDIKRCDQSIPRSYYTYNDQRTNARSLHRSYSCKSVDMDHRVDEDSKYTGPRFSVTPYISTSVTPNIISPRSNSASGSPKRSTGAMFTSNTHDFESRKTTSLWYSSSQQSSAANSPPRGGLPLPTRTSRINGKEFFRQVRNRLSYEQFRAFLANIKELNAQKQTREETLRKANEIFGTENKDLYMSFQELVPKNKI